METKEPETSRAPYGPPLHHHQKFESFWDFCICRVWA